MTSQPDYVDAITYLQVEPEWARWSSKDIAKDVRDAKIVRSTQNRPDKPLPGTVLVKVTVRVPKAAFLPLSPEAVVTIPMDMAEATTIEVEAGDPT